MKKMNLNEYDEWSAIDKIDLKRESEPFLKLIDAYKSNCN